jgi:hypothetical protein
MAYVRRMKCPNCGAEASGKFCSACGGSLAKGTCASCGAPLLPGARFCNQCGRAAGRASGRRSRTAAAGGPSSNLPWYLLAGALLIVIGLLAFPLLRGGEPNLPGTGPATAGDGGTPAPLTGTPREQADRLFNRIMTAHDQGDTTTAKFFAPMGVQAYQMAEPLDADGLYHVAMIHNVAGDYAAGRAAAERILATNPNHLLGLAAAAESAERAGDQAAARTYQQRFIAAYDAEVARQLPEYQDHAPILPEHLAAARRATGG